MSKVALFIYHRALPGRRADVQRVWLRHLQPHIDADPAHEAYYYCYDEADPDLICVFQQYADRAASEAFLANAFYADYLQEVTPLLAGPPEIHITAPIWAKHAPDPQSPE